MAQRKTQFDKLMEAIGNINNELAALRVDVDELKGAKATTKKAETKKAQPKAESTQKPQTAVPTKLADFEPRKYDGFYRWGSKHDGFNQKSYMGMRKAYCVFKATNGQFVDSDKAYKAGIRIDYSEDGAYYTAKAEFEEKYPYIKLADR